MDTVLMDLHNNGIYTAVQRPSEMNNASTSFMQLKDFQESIQIKRHRSVSRSGTLPIFYFTEDVEFFKDLFQTNCCWSVSSSRMIVFLFGEEVDLQNVHRLVLRQPSLHRDITLVARRVSMESVPGNLLQVGRFFVVNKTNSGVPFAAGGVEPKLLKIITDQLNLRYELVSPGRPEDSPMGVWSNIIDLVVRKEADIAVNLVIVTPERSKDVDFSTPYIYDPLTFVVRAPKQKSKAFVIVRPFSMEMWLVLFVCNILAGGLLYTVGTLEREIHNDPLRVPPRKVFLYIFGTLTNQGFSNVALNHVAMRVLVAFWWFCAIVVVSSYSGTLTSFMIFPGTEPTIRTTAELERAVKSGRMQCGTIRGTAIHLTLKTSKSGILKTLAEAMTQNPNNTVQDHEHGLERVLSHDFAFIGTHLITELAAIQYFSLDKFFVSNDVLTTLHISVAMQRGFPLKDDIDRIIQKIVEGGMVDRWIREELDLLGIPMNVNYRQGDMLRELFLEDLQGAFYLFWSGHSLATCFLLTEIAIFNLSRRFSFRRIHSQTLNV